MKLVQMTFGFEFVEQIESILDRLGLQQYVRIPMVAGRDISGKHDGSQVYPGNVTLIIATVPDDAVDPLLENIEDFRNDRKSHGHLQAIVTNVETRRGPKELRSDTPEEP
jgi:hypothetical protein